MAKLIRTQIHLSEQDVEALDRAARGTGASRAELIRRAVRDVYGARDERGVEEMRAALRASAGLWADRPFTTEQYLDAIRHGKPLPGE